MIQWVSEVYYEDSYNRVCLKKLFTKILLFLVHLFALMPLSCSRRMNLWIGGVSSMPRQERGKSVGAIWRKDSTLYR